MSRLPMRARHESMWQIDDDDATMIESRMYTDDDDETSSNLWRTRYDVRACAPLTLIGWKKGAPRALVYYSERKKRERCTPFWSALLRRCSSLPAVLSPVAASSAPKGGVQLL